jgi:hypothetical protein
LQRSFAEVLTDTDSDGTVVFKPKELLPYRSVVAAVDYGSGAVTIGGPAGYEINMRLPGNAVKKNAAGDVLEFEDEWLSLIALLVRPGGGAWTASALEGGPGDADGRHDGKLRFKFDDAKTIYGRDAAPKNLKKGDVVVLIEPGQMEVYAFEIGK